MAFRATDGKFLWQNLHNIYGDYGYRTSGIRGLLSTPMVDGKQIYYVTPDCEVILPDTGGWRHLVALSDDEGAEGRPVLLQHLAPLVMDGLVFVTTGNGISDDGKLTSPRAPSFIALNNSTRANSSGSQVCRARTSLKGNGPVRPTPG